MSGDIVAVCLYVLLSVCLFVCLLAALRKNCQMDLHENFTTDVSVDKKEIVKFWKSPASGSASRNFKRIFSSLRDMTLSTFLLKQAYPEKLGGSS